MGVRGLIQDLEGVTKNAAAHDGRTVRFEFKVKMVI
jgi:hypothetical protein